MKIQHSHNIQFKIIEMKKIIMNSSHFCFLFFAVQDTFQNKKWENLHCSLVETKSSKIYMLS